MKAEASSDIQVSLFGPQLEPRLERVLAPLCIPVQSDQIPHLQERLCLYVDQIRAALDYNEFLDVPTAEHIASLLSVLLDLYESFPPEQRALVVGATGYFLQSHDAEHDLRSPVGFDDDVAVLNHVLDCIGFPQDRVEP